MELITYPLQDCKRDGFVLPEHADKGLSLFEQAQDYASHISAISREYVPLSRSSLPDRVLYALDNALCQGHPAANDHLVFQNLSQRKLTSGVRGDLHPAILKHCLVELSHPVACIYRKALESHTWPGQWHVEHQVMIPTWTKCVLSYYPPMDHIKRWGDVVWGYQEAG